VPRRALSAFLLPAAVCGVCVPRDSFAGAAAKLTYVRAAGAERCADEGQLREAIAARVGYDLFFPWAPKSVVVEVRGAKPRGYRAVVQIVDDHGLVLGQRSLDSRGDDCADLLRALALAISIAVDDRSLEYVPPPPSDPPVAADPARPSDPEPEPPAPAPTPVLAEDATGHETAPPVLSFSTWVTPLVTFDSAPGPAVGAEAEAVVTHRNVSVGLGIRADAPASVSVPPGGSVSTWLAAVTLAPCLRGPLGASVCGLGAAGWFAADGHVASPNRDGELFAAAGGRLGFDAPVGGRFVFVAHADALAALTRFDVKVGAASVFRVPPVSIAVGTGLGVRF
jgi:hypothetical protein